MDCRTSIGSRKYLNKCHARVRSLWKMLRHFPGIVLISQSIGLVLTPSTNICKASRAEREDRRQDELLLAVIHVSRHPSLRRFCSPSRQVAKLGRFEIGLQETSLVKRTGILLFSRRHR